MNIWENALAIGIIVLASILWVIEQILGGTVKSKKVTTIGGMYPPGADQLVRVYFTKTGNIYKRTRGALGQYLRSKNPSLYQKIKGLFL